jgi:hypothetical protein
MTLDGAGFNGISMSAISPDGRMFAWVPFSLAGTKPIMVRSLDGFESRALAGTEDASGPSFSPAPMR